MKGIVDSGGRSLLSIVLRSVDGTSWFGQERQLEVVANDGEYPLLGVGLLLGLQLQVDYRNLNLSLKPVAKRA